MEKYTVTVNASKTVRWFKHGTDELHRVDGPAVEYADGTKEWWVDGKLHRTDGPAVEHADGTREWLIDGKLHRTDGPAVERADGMRLWFVDGKYHRTDGPAVEYSDGSKEWWIDGELLTREEFEKRMMPSCDGKIVEIDGKKYKLTEVR